MSGAQNIERASSGLRPAPTRLRQIALATNDLERAKYLLTFVVGAEVIFEDLVVSDFGLKNFLIALGGYVIECISPVEEKTTAGRFLEKRGGDFGYIIIMQTEDVKKRMEHIEAQ